MGIVSILLIILAILVGIILWGIARVFPIQKLGQSDENKNELVSKLELLENSFKNITEMNTKQITELKRDVTEHLKQSRETLDSSSRDMHDRVRDFTSSITQMGEGLKNVNESVKVSADKMSSFQDIFKTPKLRGQWGESNLEYLLEQTYSSDRVLKQHYFKEGKAVDFAIKLPNDLILPIDSKFPLEVVVAYMEENESSDKTTKKQIFIQAVKKQIDDIASRYIKPQESTTDFALLYIPAEVVYYEIMFNMQDSGLWEYGQKKRVILTSPNTLYLTLQVVEHWVKDVTVAKETKEIIKRLNTVLQDGAKLSDSFTKLGKHISNVKSSYDDSGKRLELVTGRIEKIIAIDTKGSKKTDSVPEVLE